MADPSRCLPKLWLQPEPACGRTAMELTDDALKDALLFERAECVEKEVERAVMADFLQRRVGEECAARFILNRVVRNALERSSTTREVKDDDMDEAVMAEIDATAARVAHDISLTAEHEDDEEDPDEYLFAAGIARRLVTEKARSILSRPLVALFDQGMKREVVTARSVLSNTRRERYRLVRDTLRERCVRADEKRGEERVGCAI